MIIDVNAHFTQHPLELDAYQGPRVYMPAKPKRGNFSISDEVREA